MVIKNSSPCILKKDLELFSLNVFISFLIVD